MRFIIFLILGYLLYGLIRSLLSPSTKRRAENISPEKSLGEEEMIKDPYCQVYVLRRDAYPAKINGEDLYFCSRECLEKYKREKA